MRRPRPVRLHRRARAKQDKPIRIAGCGDDAGVRAEARIQRAVVLRIVADRHILTPEQVGEGGACLAAAAEVHAARAPVIGDAERDEQDLERAPDLLGRDAEVDARHLHTADQRDRIRHAELCSCEHLEENILVIRALQHDVAAAVNDVKQVDDDVCLEVDAGVPLECQPHLVDDAQRGYADKAHLAR